jgi:hypothetical protein
MSTTHQDFCEGGCGRLLMTDHPHNLCPECEIRLEGQWAREAAWRNAPLGLRVFIKFLQTVMWIAGFVCTGLALVLLEPVYYNAIRHPWITGICFVAGIISLFAYLETKDWTKRVQSSAKPFVSWYSDKSSEV